jgi:hypothetical protein
MVTNTGPRAAIERDETARPAAFPNTNQHLRGQNKTSRNGHQQISSAVLSPSSNASSDPGKVTGQRWPQPSMPSRLRQIYLDVKGEQSIEQLGLTIKMMLAEPAARNLFGAVLE